MRPHLANGSAYFGMPEIQSTKAREIRGCFDWALGFGKKAEHVCHNHTGAYGSYT